MRGTLPFFLSIAVWAILAPLKGMSQERENPPLSDIDHFPCHAVCGRYLHLNQLYQNWLIQQRDDALTPRELEVARQVLAETQTIHQAWYYLLEATENYNIDYRRMMLGSLRELIGEKDYWQGRMPPPVPIWRYYQK